MKQIFKFNSTTRQWHLPFVAGICVGVPILFGWYFDQMSAGKLSSLASLSILYIQSDNLTERMMRLMICCFGIMFSFSLGLIFSFYPPITPLILGLFAFGVNYSLHKLQLTKPPGNFFFIMLATIAICSPFEPQLIPEKIGYISIGTISTCTIGFIYSLFTLKKQSYVPIDVDPNKAYKIVVESMIYGVFIALALALGLILDLEYHYWTAVSCLAVMQGANTSQIWMRGTQRIIGTFIGVLFTWGIASLQPDALTIAISIVVLQIVIEFLVVRNYAIAVIFISILTIFLAESGDTLTQNTNSLFFARLIDIGIGSVIGMIGGWFLYNQRFHNQTIKNIRKAKIVLNKKRP